MARSRMQRIDKDLDDILRELSHKEGVAITQASRNLAKAYRSHIRGRRIKFDVEF